MVLVVSACGGGGSSGGSVPPPPPLGTDAALASLALDAGDLVPPFDPAETSYSLVVPFGISRIEVLAATRDADANFIINAGDSGIVDLLEGDNTITITVTAENGTNSNSYTILATRQSLVQQAYVKASNTDSGDRFGTAVALSSDGNTMAISASREDGPSSGVNNDETNNSASNAGAVYVFSRDENGGWVQDAYIKASNTDAGDRFGTSLALSADGLTLAIGAEAESSAATGVDGDQADDTAPGAGAVYLFTREVGGDWVQQAYLKASNTSAAGSFDLRDSFGKSVALSADGSTLVVGAPEEDNIEEFQEFFYDFGAAYVFQRSAAGVWTQQAYLKASWLEEFNFFGHSVALSADGKTIAVGAIGDPSSVGGINPAQHDGLFWNPSFPARSAGAAYVFVRGAEDTWVEQAFIKAPEPGDCEAFGYSVALSADGNTLAVGGPNEDQLDQFVICADFESNYPDVTAGTVSLYVRDAADAWTQQGYLRASNTALGDNFGVAVALSGDGNQLVVGANGEDGAATGINGAENDQSANSAGAAYVFARDTNGNWTQQAYVKASNTGGGDHFGASVAVSGDGVTFATGANLEDSAATGTGGNQAADSAADAGAVYVFQ